MSDASVNAEHENAKEGIDLRPDGGVHLWIDGRKHRLRRPRAREFRKLREELQDHLDGINEASDSAMAWAEELQRRGDEREENGEPRMTAEERAEDRRQGRAIRDLTETLLAGWWASVIASLGVDSDGVDAEDVPAWLQNPSQALGVLDHWRSAPSLSGAP